jgi:MipA family protein
MGKVINNKILLLLCLGVTLALPVFSAENSEDVADNHITEDLSIELLGIAYLSRTDVYKGKKEDGMPIPIIRGSYKRFYLDADNLGYLLQENQKVSLSLIASPRFMGFEDDDSPALSGMSDRDWSLDGGFNLELKNKYFNSKLEILSDILGRHDGIQGRITFSKKFFRGRVVPRIGVEWQSKDLVDYYYGVRPNESRAGRPEYQGQRTINYMVGSSIRMLLKEQWVLFINLDYKFFGSQIKDSPIVDEDGKFTYILGISYRF